MMSKAQRKKKILIADNSVTIQKLVHLTFAEMDFEVITASDGADALSKSKTLLPELVLADCRLDQLDGPALCEEIRTEVKLAKCRVILLQGADDKSFEARIRGAKPDAVLAKPFDAKGLIRMVKDLEQSEEPTLSTAVGKKLEAIAAEVVVENLAKAEAAEKEETTFTLVKTEDEETNRVKPQEQMEFESGPLASAVISKEPGLSHEEFQKLAELEIRAWIEKNLPAIAERILKEEISRVAGS